MRSHSIAAAHNRQANRPQICQGSHFYFRASNGSVTLPAAGYDYDVNWAISIGGIYAHWNGS